MDNNKNPEILYKYRCWDDDHPYDKRVLTHSEIFFSSPANFNDPFDCRITPRYDRMSEEDFYRLMEIRLRKAYPNTNDTEVANYIDQERNRGKHKDEKFFAEGKKRFEEDTCHEAGICSMTLDPENILMWSHYSNAHTGFCIGFDYKLLDDFLFEISSGIELLLDIKKVKYPREYPLLEPKPDESPEIIINVFINKADDWKYEKEYRVISIGRTNFSIVLNNTIIKSVILGSQMPLSKKNEIIAVLRNRGLKVELFQAYKKEYGFSLEFERIQY